MIIGICGLIGSGKDTVANLLIHNHDFHKTSFADKLKDAVASMFDWDRYMLEGKTEPSRKWRESPDPFWSKEIGRDITPRYVLQRFGTECMRQGLYDGIWVSLTKKQMLFKQKPWITSDILGLMQKRDIFYKDFCKEKNPITTPTYSIPSLSNLKKSAAKNTHRQCLAPNRSDRKRSTSLSVSLATTYAP